LYGISKLQGLEIATSLSALAMTRGESHCEE